MRADQHSDNLRRESASPRHRPVPCTSAERARHSTTGSTPGARAATLVLRIEDTDRERSTPENVEQILDALRWLELDWDEGPLSQAERSERHRERIARAGRGRAAPIRDTATADDVRGLQAGARQRRLPRRATRGRGRGDPPAGSRRGRDRGRRRDPRRGPVREPAHRTTSVIARGDGTPLYNFAVAVDDLEMGITDVIRGDDHLSNTPKQLLVFEALGADAAPLRAPAAAARARRQEALQAPRRRLGPGAARRRLPAGRAAQLPRAARLGRRRRRRRSSRPPSWSSGSRSSASGAPRRSSTSASCAGSTAATCARCRSTTTSRRRRPSSSAAGIARPPPTARG